MKSVPRSKGRLHDDLLNGGSLGASRKFALFLSLVAGIKLRQPPCVAEYYETTARTRSTCGTDNSAGGYLSTREGCGTIHQPVVDTIEEEVVETAHDAILIDGDEEGEREEATTRAAGAETEAGTGHPSATRKRSSR